MAGIVALIVVGILLAALLGLWIVGERGRLMHPSTWAYLKEGGWPGVRSFEALHFYIYARWTNQYIGFLLSNPTKQKVKFLNGDQVGRWWADHYHGKVVPLELAQAIIQVDQDIHRDLEQIIPYPTARKLVLESSPDVVVYECGCRHAREEPCSPTQVCMVIGKPFTDFILEHNPDSSRRLTQAEALELLREEHERGHVHTAYFKDACLERFYAICNCCSCCCGGMQAMRGNVPMVCSSGYVARIDADRCAACGTCAVSCPFGAIQMNSVATVDWELCMGCGVCTSQCPDGMITLERDERKGIPLDVRALS
jgi:NAD-dependent dihydropyrimidine dehydrogenase PreA subunit